MSDIVAKLLTMFFELTEKNAPFFNRLIALSFGFAATAVCTAAGLVAIFFAIKVFIDWFLK